MKLAGKAHEGSQGGVRFSPLEALCSLRPQFFYALFPAWRCSLPKPPQPLHKTKGPPEKLWIEPEVFLRRALEQEGNPDRISAKIREEKGYAKALCSKEPPAYESLGPGPASTEIGIVPSFYA